MARAHRETRARAFAEFARLGQDLNQSAVAEALGITRQRVHTLFKVWKGIEAKRLYGVDGVDSATAPVVDRGYEPLIASNAEPPMRVPNQEDSRALDASTVDLIIDEAILAGLDFAHLPPLKARQLIAAAESCRRGSPPVLALMEAGVGRTTAYAWLKDPKIRDFFDAQDGRFVGVATSRAYEIITTGPASVAMQGIQFMLERRFPEFRKNDRVDIHAQFDSEINVSAILSSDESIILASSIEAQWQQGILPEGQLPPDVVLENGAYKRLLPANVSSGELPPLPPGVQYDTVNALHRVINGAPPESDSTSAIAAFIREVGASGRGGERVEGDPDESRGGY
jgi:hypothetical protein